VAPLPKDLLDRRVEITGPVDRKMVINAVRSSLPLWSQAAGRAGCCTDTSLTLLAVRAAAQLWEQRVYGGL
jgi:hypothetical protein